MKNKTILLVGILLMMFALFTNFSAKTEPAKSILAPTCPIIKNNLSCQVLVLVEPYDCMPSMCAAPYNVVIPPLSTVPAVCTCTNGSAWCSMKLTIVSVGGVPISPAVTVAMSTTPPGPAFTIPVTCGSGAQGNVYFEPAINGFLIY